VAIGVVAEQETLPRPYFSVINCAFVGNASSTRLGGSITEGFLPIIRSATLIGEVVNNTFVANSTNGDDVRFFSSDLEPVIYNTLSDRDEALDPLFVRVPDDGGDGFGDDPFTANTDESINDDFGDLRLRSHSPAIDAGRNTFRLHFQALDLAGAERWVDDLGIAGDNVDIGAYEFQGTTCLADVNQDGVADPADFNAWVAAYNDGSPLADQNRDGVVNPADFNAWVRNLNAGCP
ncbi:MAG: GC-type dockerin domain-anchored protein, partial [Planctomycetota bacterium]